MRMHQCLNTGLNEYTTPHKYFTLFLRNWPDQLDKSEN